MGLVSIVSAIVISAALAGCESEESFYPKEQEFLRGSPAMRRDAIDGCYRESNRWSADHKVFWAKKMNVSPRSNVARIYCTRFINGIANGRLSYEDIVTHSPQDTRVMQGR
ncbi:hypothetical protein ACVILI_004304 [Mesorhizobium sp. USDA 4775]|uniref:hypothetical protein n=1 Tax=Mesorhizobium TaxID=68287 RepID=UPI00114D24DC|nr:MULTISPECIES: hypothetical protein [Mesorhizobium]AID30459.2 hypothetical protein MCHK_2649 [Mesorhizobium huakuii 7653R]MCH4559640.1 hypothetical protein [Mesorhizobium jarvisii]